MRLKLYRAATISQAMAQVRADLGSEALILSSRRVAGGVEITAALEPEEASLPPQLDTGAAFRFHGLTEELCTALAGCDLVQGLAETLRFSALPLLGLQPPVLFAGTPGAGKTSTVARLATRLVLGGYAPLVITADGQRAGAAEELAAFTRLLGIGLIVASTPRNIARALLERSPETPVLIDTAGVNPFENNELDSVPALAAVCDASIVLVAPAGQDVAEAAEQASAFAQAGARFLLPTRVDLARRFGSVLAAARAGKLALTEAGLGPGATGALEMLTPESVARRLLAVTSLPAANQPPEVTNARSS